MERFAERYCKDNPDVFATSDGAYLLSFALIMLNTDAHNPMADKKLTLQDFLSMCQYQVQCQCLSGAGVVACLLFLVSTGTPVMLCPNRLSARRSASACVSTSCRSLLLLVLACCPLLSS